jgi:hypothetical protein
MFASRIVRWAALAVVVVGCAIVVRAWAEESDKKPDKTEPLVFHMYVIKEFLSVAQEHPFNEAGLPPIDPESGRAKPDGGCLPFPGGPEIDRFDSTEWISLIERLVSSQSDPAVAAWSDEGGPASIEYIFPAIFVTQTPAAHKKIEAIFEQYRKQVNQSPSATVHAKWVQVDADKAGGLLAARAGEEGTVISEAALDQTAAKTVYEGHVRCMDCQVVYLASGEYRVYLAGAKTVAAGGTFVCEPQMASIWLGAVLQVRTILSPDGNSAAVDLCSFVTDLKEMRSRPLPDLGWVANADRPMKVALETPAVLLHTFAATARVQLGKPVIFGSMTQASEKKDKVLLLVLEVTATK